MRWFRVNISPRCLRSGHRNSLQRRGPFPRSGVCIPERQSNPGKQHSCFGKYSKRTKKKKKSNLNPKPHLKSLYHRLCLHVHLDCPPADNSLPRRPSTGPPQPEGDRAWPTQAHGSLLLQAGEAAASDVHICQTLDLLSVEAPSSLASLLIYKHRTAHTKLPTTPSPPQECKYHHRKTIISQYKVYNQE